MVKLTVIHGSQGTASRSVADIYLRRNLSTPQIEEVHSTLERSAKGPFSVREVDGRAVVEVTSMEDLALVRSTFPRIVDAWKETSAEERD